MTMKLPRTNTFQILKIEVQLLDKIVLENYNTSILAYIQLFYQLSNMKKEIELYEVIYLLDPSFTQPEINAKVQYYQDFLIGKGSQVMVQNRGKRSLSYPIKGFETANYIQMLYLGNGKLVNLLNQEIKRDASVLRNMTTKVPETVEIAQLITREIELGYRSGDL